VQSDLRLCFPSVNSILAEALRPPEALRRIGTTSVRSSPCRTTFSLSPPAASRKLWETSPSSMSKVRDALRRSETWPQQTAAPIATRPAMGPPVAVETPPDERSVDAQPTMEFAPDADESLKKPRRSRFPRLRRLLRFFGIHVASAPVPRCGGTNRRGIPCRAPAMANGLCHAHGGSRQGKLEQHAHALWQRINHSPSESEAIN
jgi:hypothetical protein